MSGPAAKKKLSAKEYLAAVPVVNAAICRTPNPAGLLLEVPVNRPGWLVPPISWILPFSSHRRIQLDKLGTAVLEMCDGRRTVERIIEAFAADHKLTPREAQLSVAQFLQMLTERGVIAIVGLDKKAGTK